MLPFLNPTTSLLLFLIASSSSSSTHFQIFAQQDRYQDCSPSFSCGNITQIRYPFWYSSRPSYCGHPSFQLSCRDKTATLTPPSGLTYQVLSINDSSRIVNLARVDYLESICPQFLRNDTFDSRLFGYFNDMLSLEVYYGCGSAPALSGFEGVSSQIECFINSSTVYTYFVNGDQVNSQSAGPKSVINGALDACSEKVITPADQSAAESLRGSGMTKDQLIGVLRQGFRMVWDANNTDGSCSTCRSTGGACGFNNGKFACFCTYGQTDLQCENGRKKKNSSTLIGISVALGSIFLAAILLATWFLITRKRKILRESQTLSNNDLLSSSFNLSINPDSEKGTTFYGVLLFTYAELSHATNNFASSKELGSGGYGTVYHGTLPDGREVAVKRLFDSSVKRAEQFMNEIEILNRLNHKNLVKLYGCTSRRSKELTLVYEYVPNKTVAYHLQNSFLAWNVRMSIAKETADALAYLHSFNVIHRDVKTANILLDDEFRVKVADFGLSRLFPDDATHVSTLPQGTPGYVDPEYFNTYQVTDRSDVYSFGVVLVELISSKAAVDTERGKDDVNLAYMALNRVQSGLIEELVDPELGFWRDGEVRRMATSVAELAFRCLQQEREVRPSMEEVCRVLVGIEKGC